MPRRWTEAKTRAFAHEWAASCAGPIDEDWLVEQLMAAPRPTERQLRASSALLFGSTATSGGEHRGDAA